MGINQPTAALTVLRHGIFLKANGLSDFQEQLLSSSSLIRLGIAPTGCGKTFAFIRAVEQGKRILFVVPTRRLGQNIIRGLSEDLQRVGWSTEKIEKKVALWSSDGRELMVKQGVTNPTQKRLQDITMLSFAEGGEFVVATPESLAWLVLDPRRFPVAGVTDRTVIDVLTRFDHVVFDEMHTITDKGFSQCLIMARLASENPDWRCKITLLSATPLETSSAMLRFGIPQKDIAIIEGQISSTSDQQKDDLRIIHGDVRLHMETRTLPQLLEQNRQKVMQEVEQGRSVILIYDALYGGLTKDLDAISTSLDKMGIPPKDRLLISSADDSSCNAKGHASFCSGRDKEPSDYKVLVCTSSVEVGVTYKTSLMMIEPGHSESSFLQRFGRVARGDVGGDVYVSLSNEALARHAWLRRLHAFVISNNEQAIGVQGLTHHLTQDTRRLFATQKKQNPFMSKANWFGQVPDRAAAIAGLAWCFMMEHHAVKKERKSILLESAPPIAKEMYGLLQDIKALGRNPQYEACVAGWNKNFLNQVLTYRTIGKQVKVIYPNGEGHTLSLKGVANNTSILGRFELSYDEEDQLQVFINSSTWRDYSSSYQPRYSEGALIVWPHTDRPTPIAEISSLKKEARQQIAAEINKFRLNTEVLTALQSIKHIYKRSGLLCMGT